MNTLAALLSAAILCLTGVVAAALTARARGHRAEPEQRALSCALLGFVLAAASGAVLLGDGLALGNLGEASRWLSQSTYQLGLPLIGLAVLALGRGWRWTGPTWGRLVLGLCAGFELARQIGYSQPYAMLLALASGLAVLHVALRRRGDRARLVAGLVAGSLLLTLTPYPHSPISGLEPLLLGLAALPLAWLLTGLPSAAATSETA